MTAAPRPARVLQSLRDERRAYEVENAEVLSLRAAQARARERLHALNDEAGVLVAALEATSTGAELRDRHNERAETEGSLRASLSTVERALTEALKHADGVDARLAASERLLAARDARLLALGEAESGFIAALIGPVTTVIAGGIGAIIVVAVWAKLFPEIGLARRFDAHNSDDHNPQQEKQA